MKQTMIAGVVLLGMFMLLQGTYAFDKKNQEDFKGEIENRSKAMVNALDKNKDGKISEEESLAPYRQRFRASDLDKDGFWTQEELQHAWSQQMQRVRRDNPKKGSGGKP